MMPLGTVASARHAAGGSSPLSLPGWKTWLDESTLPGSGASVSQWDSQDPAGNHAISEFGSQTVTTTATSNGSKAVAFEGQVDSFVLPTLLSTSAVGELWMVVKSRSTGGGAWKFGTGSQLTHYPWSGTRIYDSIGVASRYDFNASMSLTTMRVYRVVVRATQTQTWLDGTSQRIAAATPMWASSPFFGKSSNDYRFTGDIAFLAVRDQETTGTDLTDMYDHLKATTGAGP